MIRLGMPKRPFEEVDISGDVGIKAFGDTLPELFANAGAGLYSLITDTTHVRKEQMITVEAKGESLEGLLVAFLNELIYRFDIEGFVGGIIKVVRMEETEVAATVLGEMFDEERFERRLLPKAATYHNVKVEQTEQGWSSFVMFDI